MDEVWTNQATAVTGAVNNTRLSRMARNTPTILGGIISTKAIDILAPNLPLSPTVNHWYKCLSQELENGCLKLAVVKFLGIQFFLGGITIYSDFNHKHVYIYQNKAWYPYAISWELYGDEKNQLYAWDWLIF